MTLGLAARLVLGLSAAAAARAYVVFENETAAMAFAGGVRSPISSATLTVIELLTHAP